MRLFTLLFIALISTSSIFGQQENTTNITVTIDNALNDDGKILFALHTNETFMKAKPIQQAKSTIENGKATISFNGVAPGEYAIIALHDENDNNRMDYEDSGMPKESYGISNNPGGFGPPQYHTAKFSVTNEPVTMHIRF
ncbi:DUF2141 domain-containing protein [Seonamhaeicola marinus]|uniref:DUF2141 domain-containing protein n=1 Tax=Seonamhaeicola marinus TaxID=1912246 RepID=A0A5D0IMM7_9FLAO|nr:DUF2141 domain-containing protein [Seonamhaeicola marinus]TYA84279.1 DUF2141 domain-containing protein [Seonamhaeicola marinus]